MCSINKVKILFRTTNYSFVIRAICASIRQASKIGRFPEPQILPATMQEISIKKELANDMKKNVKKYLFFIS
jgi:hypothetical protein